MPLPDNASIAGVLRRIAHLLETQDGDPYRIHAYLAAAETVEGETEPVARLAADPGVGAGVR